MIKKKLKIIEKFCYKYWVIKSRKKIFKIYNKSNDPEVQEVLDYLRKNKGIYTYPYTFTSKYKKLNIQIYRDEDDYPYVYFDGKKLFGRKKTDNHQFERSIRGILCEQDAENPHCYCYLKKFEPKDGAIIAELGAAEGLFSLTYIERVKKVYLFECSEEWIIPLKKTFEPWIDKVEIINKYVSMKTEGDYVSIDDFFDKKDVTAVKADIEGFEVPMLLGAEKTFTKKINQVYICAYHKWDDEDNISALLKKYSFFNFYKHRYMIYCNDGFDRKILRRGVIYAEKL